MSSSTVEIYSTIIHIAILQKKVFKTLPQHQNAVSKRRLSQSKKFYPKKGQAVYQAHFLVKQTTQNDQNEQP